MVYTVTLNPSLDYFVRVDELALGRVNRCKEELIMPGGKGINVSLVLNTLDVPSTMLGFVAGFTGKQIEDQLQTMGCLTEFISLKRGISRINVKIRSTTETEINGQGPIFDQTQIEALRSKIRKLGKNDTLVLAGSIPSSVPGNIYEQIIKEQNEMGTRIVVDTTKEFLGKVIPYHPFLIKPNHLELGDFFGVKIKSKRDAIKYAYELQKLGAKNVLVSMAEEGAVLASESGAVLTADAPKGKLVNSVGSGDAMVAGFLAGLEKYCDYDKAFALGIAAGSASAFHIYFPSAAVIEEYMAEIQVICERNV